MAAGRLAALAAAIVLGLAPGLSPASAQAGRAGDGVGPAVARALLAEARQAAGLGDWARASAFLAEASDRDPGDADVLYLASLASVKGGRPLGEALGNLNAALAADRFSYYSRRDALILKAELLVRERRWKEALGALDPIGADASADPSYRLMRARAFAGLGDSRSFDAEMTIALRRFPEDPAFPRLFLARAGRLPSSSEARGLADVILGRLARYAQADPELTVLAAPFMREVEARRDAVLAFRASGGTSAAATLRALEYGIIDEAKASSELLAGSKPLLLSDLASLLALAGSPAGRAAVHSALASWSGRVDFDSDGDGIPEGSFTIEKTLVTGWEFNPAQDGAMGSSAAFSDGIPTTETLELGGLETVVSFSAYPAVSSVAFAEKGERRIYSFNPEALSFSPLSMRVFSGSGATSILFPSPDPSPVPSERACAAAALSVTVESGGSRSVTLLDAGLPVSGASYEGDRLVSTTAYSRGSPALERIDADGDGRFETERGYSAGPDGLARPSWLRVDADGDGVFEYREQLAYPFRKEWDYDGNGSVDAVQLQLADGSIEQQFSSRLDGRLDETVIVKSGKLASLSRDGVSLALIPDSNPALTWIGRKIFDVGGNLPAGEGIFWSMGKRYRLTRIGELAFAELVP